VAANFQHLRAFHAVASEGSIVRAARKLAVSQPTISEQLRTLEQRHQVPLFQGRKPPLVLTGAGRSLFALTQRLFSVSGEIDQFLSQSMTSGGLELRLGSDSPTYAARFVAAYPARRPGARVQVRIGNAGEVVAWLKAGEVDAIIACDPPIDASLAYQAIYRDQLVLGLPCDHPFAGSPSAPLSLIHGSTLLLREAPSRTRETSLHMLSCAGIEPAETIELHTRETIREAIAIGVGVSMFYSAECPPDPRIVYLPLGCEVPIQTGYVMCLADQRRTPLARSVFETAATLTSESPIAL
jgi:DNA-binding transcriptional LysR family regulator